jgi:hypothetical protein
MTTPSEPGGSGGGSGGPDRGWGWAPQPPAQPGWGAPPDAQFPQWYPPPAGQPHGQWYPHGYGYSPPPWDSPPPPQRNGMATAAFVLAVFAVIPVSVPLAVVGLKRSKRTRSGRGLSIAALAISAAWAVLVAGAVTLAVLFANSTSAADLEAGDCLARIPSDERVRFLDTVPCEQAHAGEVYAVLEMPAGEFPGDAAVVAFSRRCGPALQEYAAAAATDRSVEIYTLYPTSLNWRLGDRSVTCIAATTFPRTGSLKDFRPGSSGGGVFGEA